MSLKEKLDRKKRKYLNKLAGKEATKRLTNDEEASRSSQSSNVHQPLNASSNAHVTPKEKKDKVEKEIWRYEGENDEEGLYHGVGRLSSTQTIEFYEGQWTHGKRDGFGTQLFATGEKYQGAWKDDSMDGMGVITFPSKNTFTGEWSKGQRVSGSWTFTRGDSGAMFVEKWVNGAPGPVGELQFTKGGKYTGQVSHAVVGKYTIKNYQIFRNGYGEMQWKDGSRYIGGWKKDKAKGFGIMIDKSGESYYGEWQRGKRSGFGIQLYADGTFYEGQHLHDEMKGKGKLSVPSGDVIVGEWENSRVTNAQFYKGEFTSVPRPLRHIFINCVQQIQKEEEKSPFISTSKWNGMVAELVAERAVMQYADIVDGLKYFSYNPKDESTINRMGLNSDQPVVERLVTRFIYLFNWEYGEAAEKKNNKKITLILQSAVDDVNSFLACMTQKIAETLKLEYEDTKFLYERFMTTIFSHIYDTIFPLYIERYSIDDALAESKCIEMSEVTTKTIGVKKKYLLEGARPFPDTSSTSTATTSSAASLGTRESHSNSASSVSDSVASSSQKNAISEASNSMSASTDGLHDRLASSSPAEAALHISTPALTTSPSPPSSSPSSSPQSSRQVTRSSSLLSASSSENSTFTRTFSPSKSHSLSIRPPPSPSQSPPGSPKATSLIDPLTGLPHKTSRTRPKVPPRRSSTGVRPPAKPSGPKPRRLHAVGPRRRATTDECSTSSSFSEHSPSPQPKQTTSLSNSSDPSTTIDSSNSISHSNSNSHSHTAQQEQQHSDHRTLPHTEESAGETMDTIGAVASSPNLRRVSNVDITAIRRRNRMNGRSRHSMSSQQLREMSQHSATRETFLQLTEKKKLTPEELELMREYVAKEVTKEKFRNSTRGNRPRSNTIEIDPSDVSAQVELERGGVTAVRRSRASSTNASLRQKEEEEEAVLADDPRRTLPYYAVIRSLDKLQTAQSPIEKLRCISAAGDAILAAVDAHYSDKSENILMGAEDKFPVLIYGIIHSHLRSLYSHAHFLSDFVNRHVGDMDREFLVSNFMDALKYIRSLEWQVRDSSSVLVPVKLLLSNISWAAKGLPRLKIPDSLSSDPTSVRTDIVMCLNAIFRQLGSRVLNPYDDYPIPSRWTYLFDHFHASFFERALGKEVGLEVVSTESSENGAGEAPPSAGSDPSASPSSTTSKYALRFVLKHPLYIYARLAEVALAPASVDEL